MVLLLVTVIGFAMMAFSALFVAISTHEARANQDLAWVQSTANRLRQWYSLNPLVLDGSTATLLPGAGKLGPRVMAAAGIKPYARSRVEVSGLQSTPSGVLRYRTITVWIPKPTARTGTGFSPAAAQAYATVSGLPIEQGMEAHSWRRLENLATRLEQWSASAEAVDGTHNTLLDYFEPPGCGVDNGAVPGLTCAANWTNASDMGFGLINDSSKGPGAAMGLGGGPWVNAWGGAIRVCNTPSSACSAVDQAPPFSMWLETTTPWGGTPLKLDAIQPFSG
ncbi:MAG TPA: hypothetical protein ENG77_02440 [Chromatiales bacterium]|nr:hypothetical protein [Chromatiales bacterium]